MSAGSPLILSVVGNPRPQSRTHGLARTLAAELAAQRPGATTEEIDLAAYGPRALDYSDPELDAAAKRLSQADLLLFASPTYKGSYSGLLKAFLDRVGGGALAGAPAVPVLLGGAPDHALAVNVHFIPLLLELGARVPAGGLFVLESALDEFPAQAAGWAQRNGAFLLPAS